MDRNELEQHAGRLTELDVEYLRAQPKHFGPLSKERAEEADVIMAEIRHPESKR